MKSIKFENSKILSKFKDDYIINIFYNGQKSFFDYAIDKSFINYNDYNNSFLYKEKPVIITPRGIKLWN